MVLFARSMGLVSLFIIRYREPWRPTEYFPLAARPRSDGPNRPPIFPTYQSIDIIGRSLYTISHRNPTVSPRSSKKLLEEALRRRLQGPGLNRWVLPDPWHLILSIPGIHGSGSRCRAVGLKTSSMT